MRRRGLAVIKGRTMSYAEEAVRILSSDSFISSPKCWRILSSALRRTNQGREVRCIGLSVMLIELHPPVEIIAAVVGSKRIGNAAEHGKRQLLRRERPRRGLAALAAVIASAGWGSGARSVYIYKA